MSHIIFPAHGWQTAAAANITYTGESSDAANNTTTTFASMAIGAAAADRHVIVAVGQRGVSGNTRTVTAASTTIGGVAVTKLIEVTQGSGTTATLVAAPLATGTTADIVITLSGAALSTGIGVWRATGLGNIDPVTSGGATASDITLTGNALSASLDIPVNGGAVAASFVLGGPFTCTWTNLTESFDADTGDQGDFSGALSLTSGTSTRTATWSGTPTEYAFVAASWGKTTSPKGSNLRTFGTNIGNMTGDGGLAAAFDGTTSKAEGSCASITSTSGYIGKTYSSRIYSVTCWPSSGDGFIKSADPSVTLTLYGKQGAAPSSATDGTSLGSTTFTDTGSGGPSREITSSDTTTVWDHFWVRETVASSNQMRIAQLEFFEAV